jgi:O-antigen/teichoic acid export membrane protein
MMKLLTLINFPVCTLIGGMSCIVIAILYGDKYIDAVPILAILSIWGMIVCIGNPIGNLAIAKGKTYLLFEYTVIRLVITVPLIYALSKMGLIPISVGLVLVSALMLLFSWYFQIWKVTKMPLLLFLQSFVRLQLLSILVGLGGYIVIQCDLLKIQNCWLQLFLYGIPFSLIYLSLVYYVEKNDVIRPFSFIKNS